MYYYPYTKPDKDDLFCVLTLLTDLLSEGSTLKSQDELSLD